MSGRTHLFVAPQSAPFGETVLGMRVADDLHARGDAIVVFAHESLEILVKGRPFRFVPVPRGARIEESIATLAAEVRADSHRSPRRHGRVHDAQARGHRRDVLASGEPTRHRARRVEPAPHGARMGPLRIDVAALALLARRESSPDPRTVRTARPARRASTTRCRARPNWTPKSVKRCARTSARAKAIASCSSRPRAGKSRTAKRTRADAASRSSFRSSSARAPRGLGARAFTSCTSGPTRLPFDDALGDRYTWLPQRSPARFAKTLAAADLLLSFNFSATTIASAIASGHSRRARRELARGKRTDEIASKLPSPRRQRLRAWLDEAAPLPRFACGRSVSSRFLAPLARDNPYTTAIEMVEVLEETAFVSRDGSPALRRRRRAPRSANVRPLPRRGRRAPQSGRPRRDVLWPHEAHRFSRRVLDRQRRATSSSDTPCGKRFARAFPTRSKSLFAPELRGNIWHHAWDGERGLGAPITRIPADDSVRWAKGSTRSSSAAAASSVSSPTSGRSCSAIASRLEPRRPRLLERDRRGGHAGVPRRPRDDYARVARCCEALAYVSVRNALTARFVRRCGFAGDDPRRPRSDAAPLAPTGDDFGERTLRAAGVDTSAFVVGSLRRHFGARWSRISSSTTSSSRR